MIRDHIRRRVVVLLAIVAAMGGVIVISGAPTAANTSRPSDAGVASAYARSSISVGGTHACAVHENGTVSCWGSNNSGQLGNGETSSATGEPSLVQELSNAIAIATSKAHTCALKSSGTVVCWGLNSAGQLGDGTTENRSTPVAVAGVSSVVDISTGPSNTCVVHSNGEVLCWGSRGSGALASGSICYWNCGTAGATQIPGISDAAAVSVGGGYACVVRENGSVTCWGADNDGQLGRGKVCITFPCGFTTPVSVRNIGDAIDIASGGSTSCVLRSNGQVSCWGSDEGGSLGDGVDCGLRKSEFRCVNYTPVTVRGLLDATSIDVGDNHACATRSNNSVVCWGSNFSEQISSAGNCEAWNCENPTPITVPGISDAAIVATGATSSCAVHTSKAVTCWGSHYTLGDGSLSTRGIPGFVPGVTSIRIPSSLFSFGPQPADCLPPEEGPGPNYDREPEADAGVSGYWMLEADGQIYNFGDVDPFDPLVLKDGAQAVAFDRTFRGHSLVALDDAGRVHVRGAFQHRGNVDLCVLDPGDRVASVSATVPTEGYWVFTDLGRVLTFGAAKHYGDLPELGLVPNEPIVASVPTASGEGYYMLGADGGVFAFGDARFSGSIPQVLPGVQLACPIQGIVPVPSGTGYWLVACDGGVFAFGDANFVGSIPGVLAPGTSLNAPVNGMVASGNGYLMVASDGGVFAFGDVDFKGSLGANPPDTPIVAIGAFVN